jgi:hypothetical protein
MEESLVRELTRRFQRFRTVTAIALGGSRASAAGDPLSDIDLYVYSPEVIPLAAREALAAKMGARQADLNLQFWDLGDEWYDAATGIEIDVIYWDPTWVEGGLDRVWRQHQAGLGYTTCLWHTVRHARPLYDRQGWFRELQEQSRRPYPEALRTAIVAKNHAVLRRVIPGYAHQIEKATRRRDLVSVNHRVAALLASYFDVLFALNRVLHPGEKRLMERSLALCESVPAGMAEQVTAVLRAAGTADGGVVPRVHALLDSLDDLLLRERFDPTTSLPFP